MIKSVSFVLLFLASGVVTAAEIKVAVASNFAATMKQVIEFYHASHLHRVKLISGSSGKQFAQISNGAPYDIYYAANKRFPKELVQKGHGVKGSLYLYATGQLVLWSTSGPSLSEQDLRHPTPARIAIANPRLAPYGQAAQQALANMGVLNELRVKLVRGENINQAFQYVATGNAGLGLVALSQVLASKDVKAGSYWVIPQRYYDSIDQYAVLLTDGEAQRSFYEFIKSEEIQSLIKANGYRITSVSL